MGNNVGKVIAIVQGAVEAVATVLPYFVGDFRRIGGRVAGNCR